MQVSQAVKELTEDVVRFRRELHTIPELGLTEFKTKEYLLRQLQSFGIKEIYPVIETGLIAVFRSDRPGKTLAFRTDIDALPIKEETGVSFVSKHEGKMHACGHDGHMATMLGFAKYLATHPEVIRGTIVLIFQPAEESPGGAQLMIDEGILRDFGVEKIVGLHVFPDFPEGVIASRKGPMMARNGEINLTINGTSAHGAQPHQGHDAILAGAAIIQGLHSIISRNISPLSAGVITFGKIHGGDAENIIPGKVVLKGTMRAFEDEVYETMTRRITTVAQEIAKGYDCTADVEFEHLYRVVDNDPEMVEVLEKVVGESYRETPPYMLAEDFSMYQKEIPGVFFFVGTRNEEKGYVHPLHSSKMNFDEKNLLQGIECYVRLIEALNEPTDKE
ncbi:M20 metallopeptidase family protein [Enterococcus casseliflavus]|uniref:M20 metallopeptidase family protein n=1 Tax=Enterococcus casseliflavus TaxID=37734 RepID=UPI00254380D1|nr:M20 family metallopeptidase [Enterococcus casseliflavus]MDK4448590.1 M20 family metallopeptidase [Enterococcus casseliflavus]